MKSQAIRLSFAICLFLMIATLIPGNRESKIRPADSSQQMDAVKRAELVNAYGKLPLRFESNRGQTAKPVKFISRNNGQTLFLTAAEAVLELRNTDFGSRSEQPLADSTSTSISTAERQNKSAIVRMKLIGANAQPRVSALDELPSKSNYFIGDDSRRWQTNVANFARVKYDDVYPGIDLIWHGNQRQLEHDFVLAPLADPGRIRLSFAGVENIRINGTGELVLQTEVGELKLLKPVAWQEANGQRQTVDCEFAINSKGQIGFRLGQYDRRRELVIDPVLLYSTYLGGGGFDWCQSVTVDKDANAYVVGYTNSTNFPGSSPIQPSLNGQSNDAFVLKLNSTGTAVVYGTWLGGSGDDSAAAIAVNKDGSVFITGNTSSNDFPTTAGALQRAKGDLGDGFITRLNAAGSALNYSSYLGGNGNDGSYSVAVDSADNAYVVGYTQSSNLPATGIQLNRNSQPLFKSADRGSHWVQIGSTLSGAQVYSIAIDPTNSNVLYAGTFQGVFKSTNGGQQWQLTGQSNPPNPLTDLTFVNSVAIDPSNPNIIYAASPLKGIYKSTDGGQSYQPKNTGIIFSSAFSSYDIAIDPTTPTTIYLGTPRGVFKSVNGADTWTEINNGLGRLNNLPRINRLLIDPANRMTIYVATNLGVFKTIDGGAAWSPVNTGFQAGQIEVLSLAIDPVSPTTLYAGTASFAGSLYKTTDGGLIWRLSNSGLTLPNSTASQIVQSLAIDPSNTQTVFAATLTGVFKSLDGGATWNASSGLPTTNVYVVVVDRMNPANIYVGLNAGNDAFAAKINPTGSALVWMTYLGGTTNDEARGVAVDKDGNAYLAGITSSTDFPTANPFQIVSGGSTDAIVAKINPAGTALVYSTYFGGSLEDFANAIAVNEAGQVFITGSTASANLPTKNPLQPEFGGFNVPDAFVAKFNAAGSALEYSTWLGGNANDGGVSIAIDTAGSAYVTGYTRSANFPLVDAVQNQLRSQDAFVAKLNPMGSALVYSTFLGGESDELVNGIAVDSLGNAYVVGVTASFNFPTVNPLQATMLVSPDGFIAKLGNDADLAIAKTVSRNPVMVGNRFSYELTATNNGPSPGIGVIVTDALPAGINFVSATSSQGVCSNNAGTLICNVGNLAVRASATIMLTVSATTAGSITNAASVKGNDADSNPANNQASAPVTISNQPSIFGRVALANGNPLPDVTINLTGALTANQRTNVQGRFQFANLLSFGNYTVTPTSSVYSFEPAVRDFNVVTSDQSGDFVATPCTYSLSPANQNFEAIGGSGSFNIIAPPRCPWAITTDAGWIKITSALSGAGNGSVSFAVEPTVVPRSGRITVAGQSFNVLQGVSSCVQTKRYFYSPKPRFLTTGDLNSDGFSDLLISPSASLGTPSSPIYPIGILFGNANGNLIPSAPILAKLQPFEIAAGDFNGDGKVDVASLPFSFQGEAEIFLNNGASGFAAGVNVRLIPTDWSGFYPKFLAADLNKDGKVDLIGVAGPVVIVALSNSSGGNISFGAPSVVNLGGESFLALADLNADGASDLLTLNGSLTENLVVYPNNGAGGFGQSVKSTVAGRVVSSDFADFNGDGKVDLVAFVPVLSPIGGLRISIQPGDGNGRFGVPVNSEPFVFSSSESSPQIAVRDVNGDGKPDVVASGLNQVLVCQGNGTGGVGSAVEFAKFDQATSSVAVANFEGDGKAEIAIADYTTPNVLVLSNRCSVSGLTIHGRVVDLPTTGGISSVTMKLTGTRTASTITDNGGNYSFTGLPPGNYALTPERPGAEITPANRSFTLTNNQKIDFDGSRKATAVSAASYNGQQIAQGSIVALFGLEMTSRTQLATQQPLPTSLGGMVVAFKNESAAREYNGRLFFVSPNQINVLVPLELSDGPTTFRVFAPNNYLEPTTIGAVQLDLVAPGLFAADASGRGLAAAVALRVKADGSQVYEPITRFDPAQNKFVAIPIDVSNPAEQLFLLAFGTGISGRLGTSDFQAKIGGDPVEIAFVGPQGEFAGLDQLNLRLPRSLAGRGNVDVVLTVGGKPTNTVQINIR